MARGGPRRGIGGGPVHHAGLNKLERLAGRSVPSSATPYSWLDLTPRFLQRAEQCWGMRLPQWGCTVCQSGAAFMLKTGPELLLGPSSCDPPRGRCSISASPLLARTPRRCGCPRRTDAGPGPGRPRHGLATRSTSRLTAYGSDSRTRPPGPAPRPARRCILRWRRAEPVREVCVSRNRNGDAARVRRGKVLIFSGCNSHPATGSLQPVAIGATVEVTKPSEPSRQMCRFGDAASRQAVT